MWRFINNKPFGLFLLSVLYYLVMFRKSTLWILCQTTIYTFFKKKHVYKKHEAENKQELRSKGKLSFKQ